MYFVNGIVPGLCDENGAPNRSFKIKIQMIKLLDIEELILKMFDEEASPNLYFHNSSLVKSISNNTDLLATSEKLSDEEYVCLKLAAMFLFSGYIYNYEKPMEASIRLVEETLPKYGFNQAETELTVRLIRNSFDDRYESITDRILHDARYDYLGRVDYVTLTGKLLRERTEYGHTDTKSWIEKQKQLLKDHKFLTNTANLLRSVPAEEQLTALSEKID
jgi:hypothetical protein